jgi:LPS export ABC transporter protein LptC/lipopolysaccharide transport protein LptA
MAITMDGRGTRWGPAPGKTKGLDARERAFRQADRHSRLVRALRVWFPLGAAGLLGFYALTLNASWQLGAGRLKVDELQFTTDDLTMKNPKYFGLTKDGGSYEVRAKKAILEFSKDAPVKLVDIEGDLLQASNVATRLKARYGLLDNAKSELELYDGIEIDASNGLKARLSRAMVYSKEHRIVSKEPVDLTLSAGRVRGSAMTLRTDTREATFLGDVRTRLVPSAQPGDARAGAPAFGANSREPVDVTSDQLYVNDTAKTALFMGKVVAVQGESTLKAQELHINYEGAPASDLVAGAAQPTAGEGARLSRLVAKDGALVTIGADRRVTSDQAEFDVKADTALFVGNVLVNQQKNVLQGRRLFIDRKAGTSRLEAPAEGDQPAGRIAATFYQGDGKAPAQGKQKRAAEAPAAAAEGVLGSFKTDPNAPLDVEADTLDVRDAEKRAVFHGNVKAQQGEVVIRTVELIASYSGQSGLALSGGEESRGKEASQITRIEAKQKVLISSKDGQSASGDWAIFDTKANTVLLGGGVTVSRGRDVVQGERLKIDLTTGMYRFEDLPSAQQPVAAPATSASQPLAAPPSRMTAGPEGRTCAPGRQCALIYPKDAEAKAKDAIKKAVPGLTGRKAGDGWEPSTSASPAMRSQ